MKNEKVGANKKPDFTNTGLVDSRRLNRNSLRKFLQHTDSSLTGSLQTHSKSGIRQRPKRKRRVRKLIQSIDLLRDNQSLRLLLETYQLNVQQQPEREWYDRIMELPAQDGGDLSQLHGSLIANGWIETRVHTDSFDEAGRLKDTYRITRDGKSILRMLSLDDTDTVVLESSDPELMDESDDQSEWESVEAHANDEESSEWSGCDEEEWN